MWLTVLTIVIGFFGVLYFRMRQQYSYFRSKGIAEDPAYFPLGSNTTWKLLTGRLAFIQMTDAAYKNFPNQKVCNLYFELCMGQSKFQNSFPNLKLT
jgi:hypothetical protein